MSEDQEKVYRPQRKKEPVDLSEITGVPAVPVQNSSEPEVSLQDVLAVQRHAGINVPNEDRPVSYGQMTPRPKEGISVTGNMPPAMRAVLQQRIAEVESDDSGPYDPKPMRQHQPFQSHQEMPVQLPPHQSSATPLQPGQLVTNDPNLNALLTSINTQVFERVVLPSMGRFYTDPDQPVGGELHLRPMTGQEEAILSTARFMRQGRGIEMIFRSCLQERHINPEKLLSIDRTYLLIYLRAISYGHIYEVTIKCPECGHTFDYDIDLNLEVDYCPPNFTAESLQKTLPRSGFTFRYRLMTGADENEVSVYRERKTRFSQSTDDSFLYRAAMLIEEIGNSQAVLRNRYGVQSLLERLPVADVNFVRNVLNNPPFGVKTEIMVPCSACANEFPVELPYEANFFFPKERTEIGLQ